MKCVILLFLFASICAFDFDLDSSSSVQDNVSYAQAEEQVSEDVAPTSVPTATTIGTSQIVVAEKVATLATTVEDVVTTTATTATTTTVSTTNPTTTMEEPLGRAVPTVVAETSTPTAAIENGITQPLNRITTTVLLKPSLYALINEGLKQNLVSFESRIASLLHQREMVKGEIKLFIDQSVDDFLFDENTKSRYIYFYSIYFYF